MPLVNGQTGINCHASYGGNATMVVMKHLASLLILVLCLLDIHVLGALLAVGNAVPVISASDQHGVPFVFTNGIRYLLVATEMGCAKSANKQLAAQGTGYLEKYRAVYLMDIHPTPGIARIFAFPKMRKYPQRIILIDSADALAVFPKQPGRLTVLVLTAEGQVQKISYWDPDEASVDTCFK
jgi:hypothetical protein